jgi:hypothetical protein
LELYYSIRLQPDLIAVNWIGWQTTRSRPDYRKLEQRYVRVDTRLVDEAGLLRAYP